MTLIALTGYAREGQSQTKGARVTLKGSMVCNGACIPDPKAEDHVMVVFAIDGTPKIRAEVDKIMKEFYPDKGLDGDAAQKVDGSVQRAVEVLSENSGIPPLSPR